MFRNFSHEVLCFLDGTKVCTYCYLDHVCKAKLLHCRCELFRACLWSELTYKCRCYDSDDLLLFLHCCYKLEYLSLVYDSAEWTVYKTHSAGYALVIIYFCLALFV